MRPTQTTPTPQTDTDQTARLRAVIGRLGRRLRPTSAGSELTPTQTSVLFTIVRLGAARPRRGGGDREREPDDALADHRAAVRRGADQPRGEPGRSPRGARAGDAGGKRMRERIHRERTAALGAHVESLDEEQREALWAALPVLEELAEQLPGPHGSNGRQRSSAGSAGRQGQQTSKAGGDDAAPDRRRQDDVRGARDPELPPLHLRPGDLAGRHVDADGRAVVAGADADGLGDDARHRDRAADAAGAAAGALRRRDRRPRRQAPADGDACRRRWACRR